jgi:uncharacterized protein involved in type VI secretion and phage assembly
MSDASDFLTRAFCPQTHQAREQLVGGLVTAKVDLIEDDGTYRLKFLGMNGQDDDDQSAPARVMMPMAGGRRGIHFFPEKGDEVVVGFMVGDTNTPIILGAVWNRNDPPPDQAKQSADNNVRTIVSRSGHELTFDDSTGAEKVTLKSKSGHKIELDDAPGTGKITIASAGGRSITLDDTPAGSISIQTPTTQISLSDSGGSVSINAATSISLSAPTISLSGVTVSMTSASGMSSIDGSPYRLHGHLPPTPASPPSIVGPVVP